MFERDKDDLRDMGVPLVTGASTWSTTRSATASTVPAYALPEVERHPDELAVLTWRPGVAAGRRCAPASRRRCSKVEASPTTVDPDAPAPEPDGLGLDLRAHQRGRLRAALRRRA